MWILYRCPRERYRALTSSRRIDAELGRTRPSGLLVAERIVRKPNAGAAEHHEAGREIPPHSPKPPPTHALLGLQAPFRFMESEDPGL
jgi:hypothetical protein